MPFIINAGVYGTALAPAEAIVLPDGRIVFSASFDGRAEEVFGKTSASVEPQSLGVTDALLLGVSSSGDLALLLKPRFNRAFAVQGTLARVGGVGGTPRELVEQVEFADWSPGGDLAGWTSDQFINTIRTGFTPDKRPLSPELMPWKDYRLSTDDELKAVFLYLQSLPSLPQAK